LIGGAHVGYQIQLPQWSMFSSSGVVLGLEGSVDGTSLSNMPPPPIFTWTGIYVGGQIGYAWTSGNNLCGVLP
jgi:hypothetical protein